VIRKIDLSTSAREATALPGKYQSANSSNATRMLPAKMKYRPTDMASNGGANRRFARRLSRRMNDQ
jgi:hypothetical protein